MQSCQVLLQKTEESKDEIEKIGCGYMHCTPENAKKLKDQRQSEEKTRAETERARENAERERDEKEREDPEIKPEISERKRAESGAMMRWKTPLTGSLGTGLRETSLGFMKMERWRFPEEIDAGLQEKKNKSVKYARKLMEQEQTRKKTFSGSFGRNCDVK